MSQETKSAESDAPFRKWISRICVVGILAWAGYFFAFLVYQSLFGAATSDNWFLKMLQQHPASTIGIGISAVSAFFIVAVLELAVGPVQFAKLFRLSLTVQPVKSCSGFSASWLWYLQPGSSGTKGKVSKGR